MDYNIEDVNRDLILMTLTCKGLNDRCNLGLTELKRLFMIFTGCIGLGCQTMTRIRHKTFALNFLRYKEAMCYD